MISPTLIIAGVSAAVSAVAGFGLAWQLQAGNISELELSHANERIAIQRAARKNIERITGQIATAQANATTRGIVLRGAVDRAAAAGSGLRVTTASAVRTIANNPAASTDAAAALGSVFDSCVRELTTLGAVADRHASDLQLMQEAWPR